MKWIVFITAALLHWAVFCEVARGVEKAVRGSSITLAAGLTLGAALLDHYVIFAVQLGSIANIACVGAIWLIFVALAFWFAAVGEFDGISGFLGAVLTRRPEAIAIVFQLLVAKPLPLLILVAHELTAKP